MDAITLLKDDHDKVKKMLADGEETTERAEVGRTELFAKLKERFGHAQTLFGYAHILQVHFQRLHRLIGARAEPHEALGYGNAGEFAGVAASPDFRQEPIAEFRLRHAFDHHRAQAAITEQLAAVRFHTTGGQETVGGKLPSTIGRASGLDSVSRS